jgi:hypothetical protein
MTDSGYKVKATLGGFQAGVYSYAEDTKVVHDIINYACKNSQSTIYAILRVPQVQRILADHLGLTELEVPAVSA